MQLFTLFVAFTALCCQVAANKQSIGYEIVNFYYAYKAEYTSGIPNKDRRLGVACTRKNRGRMCDFGMFAEGLLNTDSNLLRKLRDEYHGTTTSPGEADAKFISDNASPRERIKANVLSKTFKGSGANYAAIATDLTEVLVAAGAAGGAAKADFDQAAAFADKVRAVRAKASFSSVSKVVRDRMGSDRDKLVYDNANKSFNWRATLQRINNAINAGSMTAQRAGELRELLTDAKNFAVPDAGPENDSHWAVIRAYAYLTSKSREILGKMTNDGDTVPAAGDSQCAPAFT